MNKTLTCTVLSLLSLIHVALAHAEPLAILPLGDSITQGGRREKPEYTYRLRLFQLLTDAGVDFTFVGSMTEGLHTDATWPDYEGNPFDLRHEGHYGWKTAAVAEKLPEWIQRWDATPDIALVHLGTNDQNSDDYTRDITEPLKQIIALLRAENPNIVVFIGHLNFNTGAALQIRPLVAALADDLSTSASPVSTVSHYEYWIADPEAPYTDTFDWAHPNLKGQEKMALRWFEAMLPYLPIASE